MPRKTKRIWYTVAITNVRTGATTEVSILQAPSPNALSEAAILAAKKVYGNKAFIHRGLHDIKSKGYTVDGAIYVTIEKGQIRDAIGQVHISVLQGR